MFFKSFFYLIQNFYSVIVVVFLSGICTFLYRSSHDIVDNILLDNISG